MALRADLCCIRSQDQTIGTALDGRGLGRSWERENCAAGGEVDPSVGSDQYPGVGRGKEEQETGTKRNR